VLRAEERCQVHIRIGGEKIDDVPQLVIDGGRIADQTDAPSTQCLGRKKPRRTKSNHAKRDCLLFPADLSIIFSGPTAGSAKKGDCPRCDQALPQDSGNRRQSPLTALGYDPLSGQ
jgi:hypothetical protein